MYVSFQCPYRGRRLILCAAVPHLSLRDEDSITQPKPVSKSYARERKEARELEDIAARFRKDPVDMERYGYHDVVAHQESQDRSSVLSRAEDTCQGHDNSVRLSTEPGVVSRRKHVEYSDSRSRGETSSHSGASFLARPTESRLSGTEILGAGPPRAMSQSAREALAEAGIFRDTGIDAMNYHFDSPHYAPCSSQEVAGDRNAGYRDAGTMTTFNDGFSPTFRLHKAAPRASERGQAELLNSATDEDTRDCERVLLSRHGADEDVYGTRWQTVDGFAPRLSAQTIHQGSNIKAGVDREDEYRLERLKIPYLTAQERHPLIVDPPERPKLSKARQLQRLLASSKIPGRCDTPFSTRSQGEHALSWPWLLEDSRSLTAAHIRPLTPRSGSSYFSRPPCHGNSVGAYPTVLAAGRSPVGSVIGMRGSIYHPDSSQLQPVQVLDEAAPREVSATDYITKIEREAVERETVRREASERPQQVKVEAENFDYWCLRQATDWSSATRLSVERTWPPQAVRWPEDGRWPEDERWPED